MKSIAVVFLTVAATTQDRPESFTPRPAARILAELDALPRCELAGGPTLRYSTDNLELAKTRAGLIVELRRDHADHERVPVLARERWTLMSNLPLAFTTWEGPLGEQLELAMSGDPGSPAAKAMTAKVIAAGQSVQDRLLREVEAVVATAPESPLAEQAYYPRARQLTGLVLAGDRSQVDRAKRAIDELLERGAQADREGFMPPRLLLWLADHGYEEIDDPDRIALLKHLVATFPDAPESRTVAGKLRQLEALGKPFPLRFTDAINGRTIDLAELKGKVVVLDFWATWCVPCKAALPHLEQLYARYHDQGLEIIGISLDVEEERGGLRRLKDYVSERRLPWPQYYLGGSSTPFTREWGINSIPQLFVIDPAGTLHSTDARGRLDTMIPELLAGAGR